jgi:hypothetical protein
MQIVLARASYDGINIPEIELTFSRLHLFPVHRRLNRVCVQLRERVPHLRQLRRPRTGIVNLPSQNEKRMTIHQQCPAAIFLDNAGRFCGLQKRSYEDQNRYKEESGTCAHVLTSRTLYASIMNVTTISSG